ncbi:MAG: conserved phage C-terminal domain-containing protein [Sulfurimonas sp.]|nr:conserved phage C-terminal domain-containing protein [Sulfurimonas sp.]
MAERRMMSKKIIHSDAFMDMPTSTQNLYFYLLLEADDDGFVNSPKRTQKLIGSNDDDAKILLAKKFILSFESGVIVLKHWKMHNYIQKDRYKVTSHTEEMSQIRLKDNNIYTMDTECIQDVHVGKERVDKVSIGKDRREDIEQIISHLNEVIQSNYKSSTTKTKNLILLRLKEGFTVDDFKQVHIIKYSEWIGTDFEKFLRPETLYGNKFESYLNQKTTNYEKMKAVNEHTGLSALQMLKKQGYAQ